MVERRGPFNLLINLLAWGAGFSTTVIVVDFPPRLLINPISYGYPASIVCYQQQCLSPAQRKELEISGRPFSVGHYTFAIECSTFISTLDGHLHTIWSLDHMLAFIYLAYSMLALLYETVLVRRWHVEYDAYVEMITGQGPE
jgi:hypothetical protein